MVENRSFSSMIYLSNIVICHSYIVKLPELELRKYGGISGYCHLSRHIFRGGVPACCLFLQVEGRMVI